MLRPAIAVVICLIAAACQTASQPLATNTFQFQSNKTRVKEAIIATFLERNYEVTRDSEFVLTLDRPIDDNFAAQLLLGSSYNTIPNARVTLTFTGSNPTTVVSNLKVVTNPGSGFERTQDFNNNTDGRASIERAMALVKQRLNES